MKIPLALGLGCLLTVAEGSWCRRSVTTVGGSHAPENVCSGDLIFSDDFDKFDLEKWQHENTLGGGGNWEFQWYNNNRTNSFAEDGILYIRPTLTSEHLGEEFLSSGLLNIDGGSPAEMCTNPKWFGCERQGTPANILNPIKSARIRTVKSFSFRYGKVEVRAKMPAGDWIWPAIWMMPAYNFYGTWPASGEIDIAESRGNRALTINDVNLGVEQASSTLHFGPFSEDDAWATAHWERNNATGYHQEFHNYQLEWTPDYLKFSIDNVELGRASPPAGGFWEYGNFTEDASVNPWRRGSKIAPFDQKFYLILNLAVGGTSGFFPDAAVNPDPKPWNNTSPTASLDFWSARDKWLSTWQLDRDDGHDASLQVDYVRVWAL